MSGARKEAIQARLDLVRRMLTRERLDTQQLATRLGTDTKRAVIIARRAGVEDRIIKRKSHELSEGDCYGQI
jgi:hypothetical protein